ncbi:AP2-like DNA-binding integrase family protein [Planktotalea frisia]|uniref:Tyrosine recombinase XerC n=1 Tax=Planktotalea frisia TaxID=696762 RepID=A0A1L9NVV9_9RHOB|nr:site-specific integrase [Planktotalea frisia]OJI93313.1 tyrosine recombinase XerC [Planktotalea frisia]PZX27629.1 AP2-like DNA-binding integrase family protein [Planktotalea frisia]
MASIFETRPGYYTAQVNAGGKRKSKSFRSKTEAKRWARQFEAALDDGKRPDRDATFGQLAEEYLTHLTETKAPSRSKMAAIRIICEYIGRVPTGAMDVGTFRDFAKQRRNGGAGPATILMDLSYIGSILRHGGALADVDTSRAVAALASARAVLGASGAIARPEERKRRPTDAELIGLRDFWAKRLRGLPIWDIVQFAIASGMRLSEITRLRWDDLDETRKTITIRDRKHPRAKKGNDQTVPLLAGPVTIDSAVIDPLAIIQDQRQDGDRIFPYDPATISTSFTRAVASCGIADLRFHDLRHDAASRLFEAGYQIEQVALVTGHRDWNMLRRYTQLQPESLHRD